MFKTPYPERGPLLFLLLFVSLAFAEFAAAETGYVTDELTLGLHRAADTSDTPFQYLKSGDYFEVLSRDRYYANVRLPDGTTGYVKINYVVFDKPAKLIVAQTAAERDQLAAELADLKSAFAEPASRMAQLQQDSAELRRQLEQAEARATTLEEANQSMRQIEERYRFSLPYSWVAGAILLCLIAGVLLGTWWVDRQSRRRHGGIRVI
ncbi:MAG TPA: TIGR04211 family SH3 domain-containing protein [Woeseiaceae bacterium]|nr:TIGR04211 family SH3 domain-containing protein [Woeseiaceae bacterium]